MANEITLTASLTIFKPSQMSTAFSRAVTNFQANMAGNFVEYGVLAVTTAAIAIPLGSVASPAWCFLMNQDPTNFIRIMNGSAGAKVIKLKPGVPAFFCWDDTAVPYAQADTATANMEYLIGSL